MSSQPKPAIGHMPFPGHRTVAEVWEEQERAARYRRAGEFGFDRSSLKARSK